jgi:DNA-binding NarL/FixJ family response regulator
VRCLIVDDSPDFLAAARFALEQDHMSVVGVASTIAKALERYAELQPDVVLIDINLGDESGFELASKLQRANGTTTVPMVLISTHTEDDYAGLIEASPAVGFLTKSSLSAAAIRELLAGRG